MAVGVANSFRLCPRAAYLHDCRHYSRLLAFCCLLAFHRVASASAWGRIEARQQAQAIPELVEGSLAYDETSNAFSFIKGLGDASRAMAPAFGSFSDPLRHKSNFGQLRITTNPAYSDEVQMQAAGFLEGYLTAERIFDYAYNMKAWLAEQTNDSFAVGDWLFAQDRWVRQQVKTQVNAASSSSDPSSSDPPTPSYWSTVRLLLAQSDSLLAGYSARLTEVEQQQQQQKGGDVGRSTPKLDRLTKWDFLMLNALGDMDDLMGVVFPDTNDGSDTSDYDSSTTAVKGPVREPNPERDASFFFRPPTPQEVAAKEADAAALKGTLRPVPRRGSWRRLTPGQVRSRIAKTGRCSALVKVTPGLDDILMGHVTWWGYASMLRIYKHYELGLRELSNVEGGQVNTRVSFSSYPGQISSADDWYLLGNGLVVTETSLDIYDHNRYNVSYGCTPAALLSWQRVLAANMLATNGVNWAELAAAYNGGTYNNQYMIINLNLFNPGHELQTGLLTITEIIPGMVVTADATADLVRGYWPSYNVPYFPEVYEAIGYRRHAAALAAKGADFAEAAAGLSYQLAPRAKIFRRDTADANDLASFRRLLRSNAYGTNPTDPLAVASPWDALCGRGDLDPEDPDVYGCYDGKVTNYKRALQLSADAINGPTRENGQPAFRWDSHARFNRMPHRGMPDVYDTEWEDQRP